MSLASKSGDIALSYPEDFDAALRCATVSGDIEIDGGSVSSGSYRLGAGLAPVRLSTISGDIQVGKA